MLFCMIDFMIVGLVVTNLDLGMAGVMMFGIVLGLTTATAAIKISEYKGWI